MPSPLVRAIYNAQVGSTGITIKRYPRTSDAAALAPIVVTSGKSYAFGAWAEIVAANGITTDYWICGACLSAIVVADEHIFQLGTGGAGSEVARAEFPVVITQTTAVGEVIEMPVFLPLPIKVLANTRLAAASAAASANNRATNVAALIAAGL